MVKVIYYDLETTNLRPVTGRNGVQIVQIGAVCKHTRNKTQRKMDIYIVPTCRISPGATKVHGLTYQELKEDQRKYNNVFSPREGLQEFMEYLNEQREYDDERIVLVAHNNSGFDSKVLLNNLDRFDVYLPNGPKIHFFDSLSLMHEVKRSNANGKPGTPKNHPSLDACLEYFFNEKQASPHDALDDADDCRRICEHGAKELGYGSYQHYILYNYELDSDDSDSDY